MFTDETMVGHPNCYTPEKNNSYPLCVGRNLPECKDCQLRVDWEPDDPYGVEGVHRKSHINSH